MKIVVQRVNEASVTVESRTVGKIGHGLMILFCAEQEDTSAEIDYFASKIAKLRIFADDAGKTNLSVQDVGGAALVISQFTLAADWRKGNRPGFSKAAAPEIARDMYESFCDALAGLGVPVERGVFGAEMSVSLVNDGPFTIVMDNRD